MPEAKIELRECFKKLAAASGLQERQHRCTSFHCTTCGGLRFETDEWLMRGNRSVIATAMMRLDSLNFRPQDFNPIEIRRAPFPAPSTLSEYATFCLHIFYQLSLEEQDALVASWLQQTCTAESWLLDGLAYHFVSQSRNEYLKGAWAEELNRLAELRQYAPFLETVALRF